MKTVCANCGIEIHWLPTIIDGVAYCCLGCSQGGPCDCDYSNLPQPDDNVAIVLKDTTKERSSPSKGEAR
ncbi:MAG: hypothetical protein ACETWB_03780 [Anaerolineae bacterium]